MVEREAATPSCCLLRSHERFHPFLTNHSHQTVAGSVAMQVVIAVWHAHEQSVIHRD